MSAAPIVVGTDGSATAMCAVREAARIAGALEAPVHIVMSCEGPSALATASASFGAPLVGDDGARERAQDTVEVARDSLARTGVATEAHVCQGDPADALITIADGVGAQMIVVGNRGMAGARRVLGSVPNRVSHRARCHVLIVATGEER